MRAGITDVAPLANLTNLSEVHLSGNRIHVLDGLLDNPGIGKGDTVDTLGNPLWAYASLVQIQQLQARDTRGPDTAADQDEEIGRDNKACLPRGDST